MSAPALRVLLADDHTLVRSGIRRILESQPGVEVLAEAADGEAAIALVRQCTDADVLVLDLKMPGIDGVEVLRSAKAIQPRLKVIVLTMHAGREYVASAVRAGADAYLLKDSAVQDLVAALAAVVAGRSYFSPAIQQQMADLVRGGEQAPAHAPLTDREREVLGWLARGLSSKQIAGELDISVRTVESHRANLMHKLGAKSMAVLIQVAIREGILDPPAPQ